MESRTLLLNSWCSPHKIIGWYEAICLLYLGKAVSLEDYDETVSSPSVTYYIPAVMQLKRAFVPVKKSVNFTRSNVLARDKYTCQYCGVRFSMKGLNYDHVLPRRQGGKTEWANIVSSCIPCNEKKGGRTPEQAGMKLLRKPARPSSLPLHAIYIEGSIPPIWEQYLDRSKAEPYGNGFYLIGAA